MKTQQEIVIKAIAYSKSIGSKDGTCMYDYAMGYTKCQEDMAKDVEYWQREFDHWHQQAMEMANKYNALLNKQD